MLLFCGSSSIRQFSLDNLGVTGRFAFPAASIIGLMNHSSAAGHGHIVNHLAQIPGNHTFVFLFGNVDLDFSYYRNCCLRGVINESVYFQRCIDVYNKFLEQLLLTGQQGGHSYKICVLAPQPSPLRDEAFVEVTARHAKISEEAIRRLGDRIDLSHTTRLARNRLFADMLEQNIHREPIRVFRIDAEMIGPDGALVRRFYPKGLMDHHANPVETHRSWRRALSGELDIFRRFRAKVTPEPVLASVAA